MERIWNSSKTPQTELVQSIQKFDPAALLTDTLHRIEDSQARNRDDLVSMYVSLDEPLGPSSLPLLRRAIAHADLSSWPNDEDFTFACLTLARATNASGNPEIRAMAIEKLKEAWAKADHQLARYLVIFESILNIIISTPYIDKTEDFYKWWDEAVINIEGSIPEELIEIAVSLNWGTSRAHTERVTADKVKVVWCLCRQRSCF